MSRKIEYSEEYADKLKEYAEKLKFSSNFAVSVTLSAEEHKMLIDSYKKGKFPKSSDFQILERADLEDYLYLERSNGGTNF